MNHIKPFAPIILAAALISCAGSSSDMNAQNYYPQEGNYSSHSGEAASYHAGNHHAGVQSSPSRGEGHTVIRDPQLGNMPAIELTLPAGFQLLGGINWEQTPLGFLPVSRLQIKNSNASSALTTYPIDAQIHQRSREMEMMQYEAAQLGMRFDNPYGKMVLPEEHAMQALLLPAVQQYRSQQVRIIEEKSIPNLDKQLWPGQNKENIQYRGRMLKIAFQHNGVEMVEELYGLYFALKQAMPDGEMTIWGLDRVFGISAPASAMDTQRAQLMAIASSFQRVPQYDQAVRQQMQQQHEDSRRQMEQWNAGHQQRMAANRASFEASQAAHRSTVEAYSQQNQAWSNNQEALFRSNQNVNDNINGYQRYNDPNTGQQQILSNQYNHQWSNGSGTTIGTDDAYFDPNRYSNSEQYYQLQPQR